MPAPFEPFFAEIAAALGPDAINRSAETLLRYAENTMPGGDRMPAGVVYPASTAQVQTIVRAANKHAVPLYPISTGNNIGLGSRSASRARMAVSRAAINCRIWASSWLCAVCCTVLAGALTGGSPCAFRTERRR